MAVKADRHSDQIKFCVSVEEFIDESDLPSTTVPSFVRQKQRKLFRKGTWDIQLTKVYESPSWLAIESKRVPMKYEVEIECNDVDRLFQVCRGVRAAWDSWKRVIQALNS
jgi:hypothetical protein